MRPLFALLLVLALCSLHGVAAADQPRVAVLPFGGDGGAEVERAVTRTLIKHGYRLVSADEFRATTARLAPTVEGAEVIRTVAAELQLVAVVMGKVTTVKRRRSLRIVVRDGRDGEVAEDVNFVAATRHALARTVERAFWKRLGLTFRPTPVAAPVASKEEDPFASLPPPTPEPPPPPPPPPPAPEPPPEEVVVRRAPPRQPPPVEEPAPRTGAQPTFFEVSIGPRAVYRQFTYASDPDDALSEFRTHRPAPALGVSVTAFARLAFPRLGVTASAEQATPMETSTSSELSYRTFSGDYSGAALIGIPWRHVVVDLAIGGGRQRFALLPQGDAVSRPRPVPNVTYDYLKAGLALRVYSNGGFGAFASGHYRHVLAAGTIRTPDWFPSARVWGAEATVGVSYRIVSWFEVRLHGDLRIYQFRMDPNAGDFHVTDGALDQYWSGGLALVGLFGADKQR